MHLKQEEAIIKTYRHHPLPFVFRALQIMIVSLPFFLFATFFKGVLTPEQMLLAYFSIGTVFFLIIAYDWLIFFADKLVITNERIVHIDWRNLFSRKENEVEIENIRDIGTEEKGILSSFKLLDYGLLKIETDAPEVSIQFTDANNPEGIKDFIYHLDLKPSKIEQDSFTPVHDPAAEIHEETNINA